MSTQAIQAGEAFIQLNIHGDEIQKSLNKIGGQIDEFGSKTVSTLSALRSAMGGAIEDGGQLGDSISLAGQAIETFGTYFGYISNAASLIDNTIQSYSKLTFQVAQQNIAQKMSNYLGKENIITKTASIAVSYAGAAAVKVLAGAQWLLNVALLGCPLSWFLAGLAGLGAIAGGVMYLMGSFSKSTEDTAKNMEALCKQNDSYRTSARQCIGTLEELSSKEALNADQKKASKSAWNELQRSADGLGISLHDLGISFDEETGKMNAAAEAMAKFKEAMRVKELEDLNGAIQAQEDHIDSLQKKLDGNGGLANGWRTIGTWVTFGWVDNAEEIQAKIDETREKLQENLDRQKTVVDFSAEYKENEAKLQEIYDKEKEAAKNALAVKLDAIHQEMEERRALLKMLIAEASARSDLSEEEMKKLKERQAALAALDAEEKKRVADAKADDDAQAQKIETDFFAKRAENEENIKWKRDLEADPDASLKTASSSSEAADAAFRNAVTALKNADETTSKEELERLKAEVEKTRKEAEKWYARREEAAAKVADIEKKAAEDAKNAAAEAAKTKEDRLKEIDQMEADRKEAEALKEEEESWKNMKEDDPSQARDHARSQVDTLSKSLKQEEKLLRQLAENGASQEEYDAQKEKISKLADSVNVWEQRLEEASVEPMDEVQEAVQTTPPDVLLAGSVDAQKKFMELQQAGKDPMEMKLDESNSLLKRLVESSENLESQMEGI